MPNQDDVYILKFLQAGLPVKIVAARLGITEGEVLQRFERMKQQVQAVHSSGYVDLCAQFDNLCLQYSLLGESLKLIASALDQTAQPDQIREAIVPNDPDATVGNLVKNFIILRPFVARNPLEVVTDNVQPYQQQ